MCFTSSMAGTNDENRKAIFWNHQQKGANIFNQIITREDVKAAKSYGVSFIRVAPDKFKGKERDFLIGNADNYVGLVPEDLETLKKILDMCAEEHMPVVLTMLSLPGSRWKQNNNDQDDSRLWKDDKFQKQAAQFWMDLAFQLRDHPALVGYNILNEPHPERIDNPKGTLLSTSETQDLLFNFYQLTIDNIRSVDKDTPIILDSSSYGDPKAFQHLKTHQDPHILYSFHMYEPYHYTNHKTNQGQLTYPGKIDGYYWDKQALKDYMAVVINFQKTHNIPSHQILVGEFGGNRRSKGLPQYFKDLTDIFKEQGWHFAFYAFREDTWDGMDYELGDKKLPWKHWQSIEKGEIPKLERNENYPQFKVLREALQ